MKITYQIVFDLGTHWVSRESTGGYKLWKSNSTHSERMGTYKLDDDALAANKAVDRCIELNRAIR
jgi:hypothetical protein